MTKRWLAVLALSSLVVMIASDQARLFAASRSTLTGRGTATFTVRSGGIVSRDAVFSVNFKALQEPSGHWSGSVSLTPESGDVRIVVDGAEFFLQAISANVFDGSVAPSDYVLDGPSKIEAATPTGQVVSFAGALNLTGGLGKKGTTINFLTTVGTRGDVAGSGSWTSGGGVDTDVARGDTSVNNPLLKGMYSGELHGDRLGVPYTAVLVIGFDGNGGITGGRISNGGSERTIVASTTPPPFDQSFYSVDSDGFGPMRMATMFDPLHPTNNDGVEHATIAVADGGRIVKVTIWSFAPIGPVVPQDRRVIGELVRQ